MLSSRSSLFNIFNTAEFLIFGQILFAFFFFYSSFHRKRIVSFFLYIHLFTKKNSFLVAWQVWWNPIICLFITYVFNIFSYLVLWNSFNKLFFVKFLKAIQVQNSVPCSTIISLQYWTTQNSFFLDKFYFFHSSNHTTKADGRLCLLRALSSQHAMPTLVCLHVYITFNLANHWITTVTFLFPSFSLHVQLNKSKPFL